MNTKGTLSLHVLSGPVAKEVQLGTTTNGRSVANIVVATHEVWDDQDRVEYHRIVVWGPLVEQVVKPYVKVGTWLTVTGRPRSRSWTDGQGVQRWVKETIVDVNGTLTMVPTQERRRQKPESSETPTFDDVEHRLWSDIPE
jgi:single stranded DNA-binding protein